MIEVDKSAAETEANAPDDGAQADGSALQIPPLELQPGTGRSDAESYRLDEFLCYHDRTFVANAYAALRKRAPTAAELARTLDDLRSGRRSKVEIIEHLLAAQTDGKPTIHVDGLPSPLLRRLSRWPLLGYTLRLLRDLGRLPVLIRHQQQFEAYSMAQQQHVVDYLNDHLAPAVKRHEEDSPVNASLSATPADLVESVMMLSDSLIELAGRHTELLAQFQKLQVQREQSEGQLHTNLVALTEAHTAQQRRLDELCRAHDETAAGQREFLVQEQRVIVEAQKVALAGLQDQLHALAGEQEKKRAKLAAEIRRLRVLIEGMRANAPVGTDEQEREQA